MSVLCCPAAPDPAPPHRRESGWCITMGTAGLEHYPHAFLEQDLMHLVREDLLPFEVHSHIFCSGKFSLLITASWLFKVLFIKLHGSYM